MEARDDALVAAAAEILRIRDAALSIDGAVATVGRIEVEPGGVNVVPGLVRFTVDARAPDDERLERLVGPIGLEEPAIVSATQFRGDCPRRARRRRRGARTAGCSSSPRAPVTTPGCSPRAGVDAAMLFVRARNGGVSHSPDEACADEDVALAVDVLAEALRRLTWLRSP